MPFKKTTIGLKLFVPLIGVIFSLAAAFTGTFAWFTLNSSVSAAGMSIKAKGNNVVVNSYAYKYDVAQDKATLLVGNESKTFSLNEYDMVFTSLNQYNPLYFQLILSGTEESPLSTSGNVTLTIEREIENPVIASYETLPDNFTSVTKYAVKGHSGNIYNPSNTTQTWNNLQNAFYQQDKDVNSSGTLSTQTFTKKANNTYTKTNNVSLTYSYTSADFYNGSLIIFLYINYDKELVESFIEEQEYDPQAIGGTINHVLENDLESLHIDI